MKEGQDKETHNVNNANEDEAKEVKKLNTNKTVFFET